MGTQISNGRGKLYKAESGEFVATINYRIYEEPPSEYRREKWSGEFTLTEYMNIDENERYVIELEDKRKGRCYLRKRVNRAVSGVPPLYSYQFSGSGPLASCPETI